MSNMYQININNAIVPVDYAGNINYDEKNTKGTLLPIKQQYPFRPDFFLYIFNEVYLRMVYEIFYNFCTYINRNTGRVT